MKALIIGYGTVGKNLYSELYSLHCDVYDKYKGINEKQDDKYDIAFVCVNTPSKEGILDCSEVLNAIQENEAELFVVKSTVLVGFCDAAKEKTGKRVVFSPEYYGGTQHCNNFEFDFTVLGGERSDCIYVQQILQSVYDARRRFFITDSKTAEMVKFMENAWLATKVTFCCEFFDACEKTGVNYEELREIFVADPRVNPAHTFVYREHPYFDSHCLNKDVPSIAKQLDMPLIEYIVNHNENRKEKQKNM